MYKGFLLVFLVLTVSGYANHSESGDVIIDTHGVDMQQYYQDMDDCQSFAAQVPVAEKATTTAVGGAVLGGVLGAIVGNSSTAAKGAGVGAVTGGLRGTSSGYRERDRVVKNCLQGRGYGVLN
ncbi:YMGG-like glycine zipper-containing protein [Halopseudomonas sp.]|uniref:YMGG-like glycine zipper-containing protein n=1 Tax=Halopseudomonas sp. TaxID=2901191 RepID=UPI0030021CD2